VKHRHKLSQRQRQRAASQSSHSEAQETDEQPRSGAGNAKRRAAHHMHTEGKRPKPRLDKVRARRPKRFDDGGTAGGNRGANDPGGEIAAANKERKSTAGRISDELFGPRSAYKHGGRQKHRGYDAGGAAPSIFNPPTLQDLTTTPKQNYVASLVQKSMPPIDRAGQIMAARVAAPRAVQSVFPLPSRAPGTPGATGNKHGGRIQRQQRHYDDGGVADPSPVTPPALAYGNGPPAPPRLSSDGTAVAAAPPRANDPTFLNRQAAAQKAAQMKQRVRQLEGKGR
jgi:hypothetical protein